MDAIFAGLADAARLHADIDNGERLAVVAGVPIGAVLSAPGHRELRSPAAVTALAARLAQGDLEAIAAEPILLNAHTEDDDGRIRVRSLECIDGHHRLLAVLVARPAARLCELPPGLAEIWANGWRAHARAPEQHWIPLAVAEASSLPPDAWTRVPEEWGPRGPSAAIAGDLPSDAEVFRPEHRGVPLRELARRLRS